MKNQLTLDKVREFVCEDSEVNAVMDDSGEFYFGIYEIDGMKVKVFFDLREDYIEWKERYNAKRYYEEEGTHTEEEEAEWEDLNGENDPDIMEAYFANDDSNHCDWDNPYDFVILE